MTPSLVFDLETIPDIEGLRRLHGWGDDETQLKRVMPIVSMQNFVAVAPRGGAF